MTEITQILSRIDQGDPNSARDLLPLVYEELKKLAGARLAKERVDHTLQPTALVHEAYLRLVDTEQPQKWNSRGHFFGAASTAMRRILVEYARRKKRTKHGGEMNRVELDNVEQVDSDDKIIALDKALHELEADDPIAAKVVELRKFVGLTSEQVAATLDTTDYQVRQKWAYGLAFLKIAMNGSE